LFQIGTKTEFLTSQKEFFLIYHYCEGKIYFFAINKLLEFLNFNNYFLYFRFLIRDAYFPYLETIIIIFLPLNFAYKRKRGITR
jgi:hypothetical protein